MASALHRTLRSLIAPAYFPVLLLAFSWSALTPAFPQYLIGLGVGVATVGLIVAMKGIGQVASDVPGGLMLASWGIRRVTIGSYVLSIMANVFLFWTRDVALITGLTLASGFFTSILLTTVMTTVRVAVPAEIRGRALSGVGGALRVGMLIGPAVGGIVADHYGVPTIFLLRATALGLGLASFSLGSRHGVHGVDVQKITAKGRADGIHSGTVARLRTGLRGRRRAIVTVGFAILTLSMLRSSREFILPLWGETIGLSPTLIGIAVSAGAAFDLLLFIPAGIVSDRWGRRAAVALCLSIFSVGLFALLPARSTAVFIVAAAVIGVGNGFGAGINMTTGTDLAPDNAVAEFLGLWRLYGDLGNAAGPVTVGAIASLLALGPAVAFTAAIGFVGVGVILLFAPETRDLG